MDLSKRWNKLRVASGSAQEQRPEQGKMPRAPVKNYETRDDLTPRPKRLNEIADFFGVSVDYLIGRAGTSKLNSEEEAFIQDIEELELEELMTKHILTIDGKKATKEEIAFAISTIRSLRNMK